MPTADGHNADKIPSGQQRQGFKSVFSALTDFTDFTELTGFPPLLFIVLSLPLLLLQIVNFRAEQINKQQRIKLRELR